MYITTLNHLSSLTLTCCGAPSLNDCNEFKGNHDEKHQKGFLFSKKFFALIWNFFLKTQNRFLCHFDNIQTKKNFFFLGKYKIMIFWC